MDSPTLSELVHAFGNSTFRQLNEDDGLLCGFDVGHKNVDAFNGHHDGRYIGEDESDSGRYNLECMDAAQIRVFEEEPDSDRYIFECEHAVQSRVCEEESNCVLRKLNDNNAVSEEEYKSGNQQMKCHEGIFHSQQASRDIEGIDYANDINIKYKNDAYGKHGTKFKVDRVHQRSGIPLETHQITKVKSKGMEFIKTLRGNKCHGNATSDHDVKEFQLGKVSHAYSIKTHQRTSSISSSCGMADATYGDMFANRKTNYKYLQQNARERNVHVNGTLPAFGRSLISNFNATTNAEGRCGTRRTLIGRSPSRSIEHPHTLQSCSLQMESFNKASLPNSRALLLEKNGTRHLNKHFLKRTSLNTVLTLNATSQNMRMANPVADGKVREEVRLDLRGQKVKSLDCSMVKLTAKLEFVYLRENKLSDLAGIEMLRRVKVLDLSLNEFKGLGMEPLASCKALQQLYLAGNQMTSLVSLPQLPNLEFLLVSQNKLKTLAMVSQPKLKVLAASKNKISTFEGFPHLPSLEHLRLEENPLLEMPHVEIAAILLAGPTLKLFNNQELTLEEQELASRYPPHTGLCIRDGWELCDVEEASASTMRFLVNQWADRIPPGYSLEKAFIVQPSEEFPCQCEFSFQKSSGSSGIPSLSLRYQWFIGGKTPFSFIPIQGAVNEVYWPRHSDIGHCLKVECVLALGSTEYPPIYSVSFPVLQGAGCPKVLKLSILGEFIEGSIIQAHAEVAWCGGTATKGYVSWLRHDEHSSPVMIPHAEDLEYTVSLDDVGYKLILMYTPVSGEGMKGETQVATSEVIRAANPSVRNLCILGEVVEGNTIKGIGKYIGGREGLSKFEWLQEDIILGGFKLIKEGTTDLTLTEEDVGLRIMFRYTPINSEGLQGTPISTITEKVSHAPPKVTNIRIVGDLREGSMVNISATISGTGIEGASHIRWFKVHDQDEVGDLEELGFSRIPENFIIPLAAAGTYLAAEYTPVLSDGVIGEAAVVFSESRVTRIQTSSWLLLSRYDTSGRACAREMHQVALPGWLRKEVLPPSLNFLSMKGEFREGETLIISYGYIGGYEGNSQYFWYLHEDESAPGIPIAVSGDGLWYHITKEAINKFVSFKCIPKRDDGMVGEERILIGKERVKPGPPKLVSLNVMGETLEGSHLQVMKLYWGGFEGHSKIQWFQMNRNRIKKAIEGATNYTYTISTEDIGSMICVSYEPYRTDGVKGSIVFSQPIGPVLPAPPACDFLELLGESIEGATLTYNANYRGGVKGACTCIWTRKRPDGLERKLSSKETLNLTLEDVGCCIKLTYTPVRNDGARGVPRTVFSDIINDGDPIAVHLIVPNGYEDVTVIPKKSYFGGVEGTSDFTWVRLSEKLHGSLNFNKSQVVGKSETYTPTVEDVGSYLALLWIPTRMDGKKGKPCLACSNEKVAPAPPAVHSVVVKEISSGLFVGEGIYHGGTQGMSQMRWYRFGKDRTVSPIPGAISKVYAVSDDDYASSLIFGFTPVREDGVAGRSVLSDPTDIILPELPSLQKLILTGKTIEGEVLEVKEVLPADNKQKHVWEKYIKEITYRWSRSASPELPDSFETLQGQQGHSYAIRIEDTGFYLQCEGVVKDVFGRSSIPVSVISPIVEPGMPKVSKLEIEGQGYHTNMYAIRGIYSGGIEGESVIQWFRALARNPDLIPIFGKKGHMYEATIDDIGYRLVAVYTPVREDGMEGDPVSASIGPIAVEPSIGEEVKQRVELGFLRFTALVDRRPSTTAMNKNSSQTMFGKCMIDVNRLRIQVMNHGSTASSVSKAAAFSAPFYAEADRLDDFHLKIGAESKDELNLMVQTRHLRDVIVLVIKQFSKKM